jgi:uncharacterized paraquat-inducible protein A
MPLKEHLIEVTKSLIACRHCHVIADFSLINSHVKLRCPKCCTTLGNWVATNEAVDDMTAFVSRWPGHTEAGRLA